MGRGPKATMSLMYWKARFESIWGSGAASAGTASGGARGVVFVSICRGTTAVGWAPVPREQEDTMTTIPSKHSNPMNHEGHEGARRDAKLGSFVTLRVPCGFMVFPVFLCALRG